MLLILYPKEGSRLMVGLFVLLNRKAVGFNLEKKVKSIPLTMNWIVSSRELVLEANP